MLPPPLRSKIILENKEPAVIMSKFRRAKSFKKNLHGTNKFQLFNKLREWLVLVGFGSIWSIAKQSQANPPCLHTCISCKDCLASRTVSFFYRQEEEALLLATHDGDARHQALSDHCRQAVATACSVTLRSLQEPRRRLSSTGSQCIMTWAKVWPGHWFVKRINFERFIFIKLRTCKSFWV